MKIVRSIARGLAAVLLLVACKERRLLARRPSTVHVVELLIFVSGVLVGWGLRAVHAATRPLKGRPLVMQLRARALRAIDRTIKCLAPAIHDVIHKPGAVPGGSRQVTAAEQPVDYKSDGIAAVSFSGCAWLMVYHVGVASELLQHQALQPGRTVLLGSSSGSIMAAALACGVDLGAVRAFIADMARDSQERVLGPVGRMSHYVGSGLNQLLPEDALQRIGHTLRVSVTRLHGPDIGNPDDALHEEEEGTAVVVGEQEPGRLGVANRLVGRFRSREELIRTLLSSCYIPGYYEEPTVMGRHLALDGGASDNLPILPPAAPKMDEASPVKMPGGGPTVTVSPYPGQAVICPPEDKAFPGHYSLFPPPPSELDRVYEQGRQDAIAFLAAHGLLLLREAGQGPAAGPGVAVAKEVTAE